MNELVCHFYFHYRYFGSLVCLPAFPALVRYVSREDSAVIDPYDTHNRSSGRVESRRLDSFQTNRLIQCRIDKGRDEIGQSETVTTMIE